MSTIAERIKKGNARIALRNNEWRTTLITLLS